MSNPDRDDEDVEVLDGLPVVAASEHLDDAASETHGRLPEPGQPRDTLPVAAAPRALPTVAVAASSFVAGVAFVSLVHRRRRRRELAALRPRARRGRVGGRRGGSGPVGELVQIVGSRSLLVDVHLLGGRDG